MIDYVTVEIGSTGSVVMVEPELRKGPSHLKVAEIRNLLKDPS